MSEDAQNTAIPTYSLVDKRGATLLELALKARRTKQENEMVAQAKREAEDAAANRTYFREWVQACFSIELPDEGPNAIIVDALQFRLMRTEFERFVVAVVPCPYCSGEAKIRAGEWYQLYGLVADISEGKLYNPVDRAQHGDGVCNIPDTPNEDEPAAASGDDVPPPREQSTAEKLETIIRDIVREEVYYANR